MVQRKDLITQGVAGGGAAIIQTTLTYPFEFLKTGLQLQRNINGVKSSVSPSLPLRAYFAGCFALNVGAAMKTATRFGVFDYSCWLLAGGVNADRDVATTLSGKKLLAAGAMTGTAESLIIVPFENIKTSMIENNLQKYQDDPNKVEKSAKLGDTATAKRTFHNSAQRVMSAREKAYWHYEKYPSTTLLKTVQEIYYVRGFRGFVQGTFPTTIRQVSSSVTRFTAYTTLKQLVSPTKPLDEYRAFGIGFVSSCAVVAFTQPIDVIKTRMQSKYTWQNYTNAINCAYRLFVEEGVAKFWKGWAPRTVKVGLSGGISFTVYQYFENFMNTMRHDGYLRDKKF